MFLNIGMERDIDVSGFHNSSPLRCLIFAHYAMQCAMKIGTINTTLNAGFRNRLGLWTCNPDSAGSNAVATTSNFVEVAMSKGVSVIDLMQKAKELSGNYENVVLSVINDHVIRISLMTEPYFWHLHPNSDEIFIGLEGTVILELEHQRIGLSAGQMFTVPKGAKHRTAPAGSRSLNLTIERADIATVRMDERSI